MEYISFVSNEGERVILPLAAAKYCQFVLRLTCGIEALCQLPNGVAKLHRDVDNIRAMYSNWLIKRKKEKNNEEEQSEELWEEIDIDREVSQSIQTEKTDKQIVVTNNDNKSVVMANMENEQNSDEESINDENSLYTTESESEDEEQRAYTCFVKPYLSSSTSRFHDILEIPLHCIELDTLLRVCEYLVLRYQASILSPGTYCELRNVFSDLDNCCAEDQKRALELLCAADLLNCE